MMMMRAKSLTLAALLIFGLAGCSNLSRQEQPGGRNGSPSPTLIGGLPKPHLRPKFFMKQHACIAAGC